jgi:hypothetical protein
VSFLATQTYSDGTVVHWDQPTPPGGAEAEYPAPTLALTGEPAGDEHRAPAAEGASPTNADAESTRAADNTARWLASAGIAIAVAAVGITFWRRRT